MMTAVAYAPGEPIADRRTTLGLARLMRMAYEGVDLTPTWAALIARADQDPSDAAALMDLSTILLLTGQREQGLELQAQAVRISPVYRRPHGRGDGLRLLAIVTAGDLMANTPLDFLLEGSDVDLTVLYVDAEGRLPSPIPEHDLAFLGIGESLANAPVLEALRSDLCTWPRPVMNGAPERIAALSRDGVSALFEGDPLIVAPKTVRADRRMLEGVADGSRTLAALGLAAEFPVIVRPLDSHAGTGLEKLSAPAEVVGYLHRRAEGVFYVAPFVDYASADSLYRKQRIAFVNGRPFISHLAVSEHWMVHYLSAGMAENAEKRAEEARFMATFDAEFALRHQPAFQALHRAFALNYFAIDCAELPDGQLLLFEADVAMIVHALDSEDLYPYKRPAMDKLFAGFRAGLNACLDKRGETVSRELQGRTGP